MKITKKQTEHEINDALKWLGKADEPFTQWWTFVIIKVSYLIREQSNFTNSG